MTPAQYEDQILGLMLAFLLFAVVISCLIVAEWKASKQDRDARKAEIRERVLRRIK